MPQIVKFHFDNFNFDLLRNGIAINNNQINCGLS